jgi:hypothetical protein
VDGIADSVSDDVECGGELADGDKDEGFKWRKPGVYMFRIGDDST